MTYEAWIKEVSLIGYLINSALSDTFWELPFYEEECRIDFERGLTPAQSIRDAMLDGLVKRDEPFSIKKETIEDIVARAPGARKIG